MSGIIHALTDAIGRPYAFDLTPGNISDMAAADRLLRYQGRPTRRHARSKVIARRLEELEAARARLEATAEVRAAINDHIEQGNDRLGTAVSVAGGPVGAAANTVLTVGSALDGTLTPLDVLPFRGGKVTKALERSVAAEHVGEARRILRDLGLNPRRRNEAIRSFDLETLRVEKVTKERTALRVFDDSGADLEGRFVPDDFFHNQTNRITRFALVNNSATRLARVTIPKDSIVFNGRVAPQLRFDKSLTGGANQTFLTGDTNRFSFKEIFLPR